MAEDCEENTVLIADIPEDIDDEDLAVFLESKRHGGGDVEGDVYIDRTTRTSLVTFVCSEGMQCKTSISRMHFENVFADV